MDGAHKFCRIFWVIVANAQNNMTPNQLNFQPSFCVKWLRDMERIWVLRHKIVVEKNSQENLWDITPDLVWELDIQDSNTVKLLDLLDAKAQHLINSKLKLANTFCFCDFYSSCYHVIRSIAIKFLPFQRTRKGKGCYEMKRWPIEEGKEVKNKTEH